MKEVGGNVAFCSSSGDEMINLALRPIFPEIKWKFDSYYRATHCAVQRNLCSCFMIVIDNIGKIYFILLMKSK